GFIHFVQPWQKLSNESLPRPQFLTHPTFRQKFRKHALPAVSFSKLRWLNETATSGWIALRAQVLHTPSHVPQGTAPLAIGETAAVAAGATASRSRAAPKQL